MYLFIHSFIHSFIYSYRLKQYRLKLELVFILVPSIFDHLSCTFEEGFCQWKNVQDEAMDHFDWQRWNGSTRSRKTGPKYDHTLGAHSSSKGDLLVCLFTYLIFYLCTCLLLLVYLFTCLLVYLFTCLLVYFYLFTCLLVYLFTCLLVHLFICLLRYLFTCLFLYLSTCLHVYLCTLVFLFPHSFGWIFPILVPSCAFFPIPAFRFLYLGQDTAGFDLTWHDTMTRKLHVAL